MSIDEELEEEVLYARAIYQHNQGALARDVFFFADGAVVFWNMADSEQKAILKMLDDVTVRFTTLLSYCNTVAYSPSLRMTIPWKITIRDAKALTQSCI